MDEKILNIIRSLTPSKAHGCDEICQSDEIDLLAILRKSLDRAIFLYNFIHEVRLSGVRASISIVRIRKFYQM